MPLHDSRHSAAVAPPMGKTQPNTDPLIGPLLADRYRLFSLLGEGGMGRVYLGEHALMRKRVAIKVLHKELTQVPEVVARFEREAMAAANIDHPNVATATDFGKLPDGSVFLVLEYVQGRSLRTLIEDGPLEIARALHIATQVASAVQAAHARKIVHRDLKPENVLLVDKNGDPDFVKVLDFGIAKVPVQEVSERGSIRPAKVITRVGMIFGTPEYMAPEQALGQFVDERADIYAMGIMLFEMLSGVRPFDSDNPLGALGQQLQGSLPTFAQRAPDLRIPEVLEELIHKMLAPSAVARLGSSSELLAKLDEIQVQLGLSGVVRSQARPWQDSVADSNRLPLGQPIYLTSNSQGGTTTTAATLPGPVDRDSDTSPGTLKGAVRAARHPSGGLRRQRAVLLGFAGTLVVGVIAATLVKWPHSTPARAQNSAVRVEQVAPPPQPEPPARSLMASDAEHEEGHTANLPRLRELAARYPKDAVILADLARAQFAIGNAGDCLDTIRSAFTADPAVNRNANLATLLWKLAQKRETSERAIHLLKAEFGDRGVDILYDLSTTPAVRKDVREAAAIAMKSDAAQQICSPALRTLFALQNAQSCEDKLALLPQVESDGDSRLLTLLKAMNSRLGCGKRGGSDCYPCLRRGPELEKATAAVVSRGK